MPGLKREKKEGGIIYLHSKNIYRKLLITLYLAIITQFYEALG